MQRQLQREQEQRVKWENAQAQKLAREQVLTVERKEEVSGVEKKLESDFYEGRRGHLLVAP